MLSSIVLVWKLQTLLFALTVALSSFLLFSVEPMTGKRILPWFGGAAAVWATCLVFYQAALLAGYTYAAALRRRPVLHIFLLLGSLALLPIGPAAHWAVTSSEHPILRITAMLALSIGWPFALLSASG